MEKKFIYYFFVFIKNESSDYIKTKIYSIYVKTEGIIFKEYFLFISDKKNK